MADNRFVRTSSGVWKLDDSMGNTGGETVAIGATPVRAVPAATQSQTPPPVMRTPSRGLPAAPRERSSVLADQARADLARGALASAETNFRLALTFQPGNPQLTAELKAVIDARDAARRSAGQPR